MQFHKWIDFHSQEALLNVAKFSILESRIRNAQESHFQAEKCSDMVSAFLQVGLFGDAQESRIQSAKISDMGSVVL